MTSRYIPRANRHWRNRITGQNASIYGSTPWRSDADAPNWEIVQSGWTIYDARTNTCGLGRKPFDTESDAQAHCARLNGA